MGKHTPGPWKIRSFYNQDIVYINAEDDKGFGIAEILGENKEANARLIASAPELLEACKVILDADMGKSLPKSYRTMLEQAIAKVEGKE